MYVLIRNTDKTGPTKKKVSFSSWLPKERKGLRENMRRKRNYRTLAETPVYQENSGGGLIMEQKKRTQGFSHDCAWEKTRSNLKKTLLKKKSECT